MYVRKILTEAQPTSLCLWRILFQRQGCLEICPETSNLSVGHFYGSQLRNGGLHDYLQAFIADMSVSSHSQYRRFGISYAGGVEFALPA